MDEKLQDLTLHELSVKGFDLARQRPVRKFSPELSYVDQALVHSRSGYLAVCSPYDANSLWEECLKPFYDALLKDPKKSKTILQGESFVEIGIGHNALIPVFSSHGEFYIPIFPPELDKARIAEDYRDKGIRPTYDGGVLEGFASCLGGSVVIIDPEIHPLLSDIPNRIHTRNRHIPRLATIIETGRGCFLGKMTGQDNNERFSLSKKE